MIDIPQRISSQIIELGEKTLSRPGGILIPFPHQDDLRMYGNEVMDFTVSGLRSM